MSFGVVVFALLIAALLWYFGFVATARMRIEKNKEREEKFKRLAEYQSGLAQAQHASDAQQDKQ